MTELDLSEISMETKIHSMADRTVAWDIPYGTPASETPWYQREGWPIRAAMVRHTGIAIRNALDESR